MIQFFGKLVAQIVHLEQKILDAGSQPCIWNCLTFKGTILLSTSLHDVLWWFSWISDQENTTILCDQNRIAKSQHLLVECECTPTYISNSSNCNYTAPLLAVNIWIFGIKYFPLTCWICLGHIDITTSVYTYGQGNPGGLSIRHSFIPRIIQRGFVYGPVCWSFMRRIPGIRGRFIPHRECQESGVNVIFFIFSPRVIHVQEESELLVRNLIDLQCLQIICRIHLLMVSSVYHCARKSEGNIWKPLNSQ